MMHELKLASAARSFRGPDRCAEAPATGDRRGVAGCSVLVLAGTQSGNALLVAEVLGERLLQAGALKVQMMPEGQTPDPAMADVDLLMACVASHGEGELPDSFQPVFDVLDGAACDLSHVRYGLVALGDRTYKNFCGGGARFEALLERLGARRVGEVCRIDASSQPFADEVANAWLSDWMTQL